MKNMNKLALSYFFRWFYIRFPKFFRNDRTYIEKLWIILNPNSYKLNLDNPITFNDKLNWLKLYYHNPLQTVLADKYHAKEYVREIIGSQYVVPNFGKWSCVEEIDFSQLPNEFVLKTTHDSSGAFLVYDKSLLDISNVKNKFSYLLKRNWYWPNREWVYKNIEPNIIADELLKDESQEILKDYKFWCFNGKPQIMYCTVKSADIYENFYDMDFNVRSINHGYKRHSPEFDRPQNFDLMKSLAEKLSQNFPFVRVDFFEVNGMVYFGEFTFYDWAGMKAFSSYEQDLLLGNMLDISHLL